MGSAFGKTSEAYDAEQLARAAEAFARHEVSAGSGAAGRWTLMERQPSAWSSNNWCEVVALAGGTLLVHGDVDCVLFASCTHRDPARLVRWIGGTERPSEVAAGKAATGMGEGIAHVVDPRVFHADVEAMLRERGLRRREVRALRDALEELEGGEIPPEVVRHRLWESNAFDEWEAVSTLGRVIAPRVYMAHAAARRLCALLDEAKAAAGIAAGEGNAQ